MELRSLIWLDRVVRQSILGETALGFTEFTSVIKCWGHLKSTLYVAVWRKILISFWGVVWREWRLLLRKSGRMVCDKISGILVWRRGRWSPPARILVVFKNVIAILLEWELDDLLRFKDLTWYLYYLDDLVAFLWLFEELFLRDKLIIIVVVKLLNAFFRQCRKLFKFTIIHSHKLSVHIRPIPLKIDRVEPTLPSSNQMRRKFESKTGCLILRVYILLFWFLRESRDRCWIMKLRQDLLSTRQPIQSTGDLTEMDQLR